jgi:hypothetical protein
MYSILLSKISEAYKNKRFFFINSFNRLSGSSNAFSIEVQIPSNEEYDSVCVTQVSIPVSYYLIDAGYNTFQLKENNTIVTITIPAGNYNINSFCTILPPILNSASPNGLTYTMTFPQSFTQNNTGMITYTVSSSIISVSFIFNANNYVNEQMGFPSGSTATFSNGILVSSNVVSFLNENTLFLHSDIVSNGSDDVLVEVYGTNTQALQYITYLCPEIKSYSKQLKAPKNQIASFYLTDENQKPINLNGQELQITLLMYKRGDYKTIIVQFIELCKNFIKFITEKITGVNYT